MQFSDLKVRNRGIVYFTQGYAEGEPRLLGVHQLDRLLLHPNIQRLGGVQALLTAGVFAWGVMNGVNPLIVAGVILFAANTVLLVWPRVRRGHQTPGLGPAERRERLDNLLYPPADDRRELGEECATFAMKMRVFNEEQEWRRERTIANSVQEIREADPDLDPFQARKDAEALFERNVEGTYAGALRDEALRLFDQARDKKAIAAKARRLVERPLAFEMGEVPHLFVALARRLDYEPITDYSPASSPPPADLADQLDSLMRDGIDLVAELSEPVRPEKTEGGWKLDGGAPFSWWEKADGFSRRIRELLIERHPALLTDYRDGYNAHVKKEREDGKKEKNDPTKDKRSTSEKMLALANYERSGPRRVVEASLEGLARARKAI